MGSVATIAAEHRIKAKRFQPGIVLPVPRTVRLGITTCAQDHLALCIAQPDFPHRCTAAKPWIPFRRHIPIRHRQFPPVAVHRRPIREAL
jgi:hypothetical protein